MVEKQAGKEIGALINRCGSMRMLSHRAVMFALQCCASKHTNPAYVEAFEQAVQQFATVAADIQPNSRVSSLPTTVVNLMRDHEAVSEEHVLDLNRFIQDSHTIGSILKRNDISGATDRVFEIAEFVSGRLLTSLTEIVSGINRVLDAVVEHENARKAKEQKLVAATITKIEEVSKSVSMISMNAGIEAARVGDAGRGFSVIALEIRKLSQSTTESINLLRTHFDKID
ncbi:methyl-accepting chemotaxis protein [Phaeobacter inhibens]|uniref:methyl-accepting chemotaxis protein n=1 Tax=Phaeobacter inhibens TaxID=221822 RepID=UPI0021A658EA|nr:methyl-accepting chemotaxis protein [Phaeobacter inhibens]UWR62766.1 methyl-accepting chemotaxis protein [Phaeobacter inhibens]